MLRGWGINCGIPPKELSDEALMMTPSANEPNIDANEEDDA